MNQLEKYVFEQMQKGYTSDQIRSFLVSKNYDQKLTEQTIINVKKNFIDNKLNNYILQNSQKGYSPEQIKDYLKKYGYNLNQINSAFKDVFEEKSNNTSNQINSSVLIKLSASIGIILIIILGGVFIIPNLHNSTPVKLLDLNSQPLVMNLKSGDLLNFKITMLNQGDPGRVDVYMTYIVQTSKGQLVLQKQETKAFETTINDLVSLELPNDLPEGTYITKVSARYQDQEALSSFTFFISKDGKIDEKLLNESKKIEDDMKKENTKNTNSQNNSSLTNQDKTDINKDKTTQQDKTTIDNKKDIPEIKPLKNNDLSDEDLLTLALDQTDKTTALSYCQEINSLNMKDDCFKYSADIFEEETYCNLITDLHKKESCKINFIMNGDVSLCDELTLEENKQVCFSQKQINVLYTYGQTGDSEVLLGELNVTPIVINDSVSNINVTNNSTSLDDLDIGDVVS